MAVDSAQPSPSLPPGASPDPDPGAAPLDAARLFSGRIRRVHTTLLYKFFMLAGALVSLVLPLLYLSLIGALGYGLYRYAAVHAAAAAPPRASQSGSGWAWFFPLAGGGIVIFFLLKPLLARPGRGIRPRALKPEDEPLLFAFVRELCAAVGAPVPRRIQVDCQVNASAGPTRGLFSVLSRNLTLTIGLPLVAGMNLRQFTGILAHELGHFAQGGGMLLRGVIMSVSFWFARVVYQRDAWDERLVQLSRTAGIAPFLFFNLIRLCVWLSRRVLWALMHAGNLFNLFLSRQLEYDADRTFARVIGSAAFEPAMTRLLLLSLAWEKTGLDLQRSLQERRLGDNLPVLTAFNADEFPAATREAFFQAILARRTGLFATHPSPGARIRRARGEDAPGVFLDERPAAALFRHFEARCKDVTMDFYAQTLGAQAAHHRLVDTAAFIGRRQAADATFDAAGDFYFGCLDLDRPFAIEVHELEPPGDPRRAAQALGHARERFAALVPEAQKAYALLRQSCQLDLAAHISAEALRARIPYRLKSAGVRGPEDVEALVREACGLRDQAEMVSLPTEQALRDRLVAALQLLGTPQLAARIPETRALLRRAEKIVAALNAYRMVLEAIQDLRRAHALLEFMLSNIKGSTRNPQVVDKAYATARQISRHADRVLGSMRLVRYPFADEDHEITMGQYLLEVPVNPKDVTDAMEKGTQLLERLGELFVRSAGELGRITLAVEQALGLPPLPTPEKAGD